MKVHFIAIGGSIMHNLAIDLKSKGHEVSGSDDEIFNPAKVNLQQHGLLPDAEGWFPERVHEGLDAVIIGRHAKKENPELAKAKELKLAIYTFPEFIAEHTKNKHRLVVGGSHGKTTVTSMIMHALRCAGKKFDYLVGAAVEGFERSVSLSDDASLIVIEGDEYTTSAEDDSPKFMKYNHHIAVLTGVAWDHMNVFPSYEQYFDKFVDFISATPKAGVVVFNGEDKEVSKVIKKSPLDKDCHVILEYGEPKFKIIDGVTYIYDEDKNKIPLQIFGSHNLSNLAAAMTACKRVGVPPADFYRYIQSYKGASKRLQLVMNMGDKRVYQDFAHAPSKVRATVEAVKKQHGKQKLIALLELHTYSSLNKDFLPQYKDTLKKADDAVVYFNPHALALKGLPEITAEDIEQAFKKKGMTVVSNAEEMKEKTLSLQSENPEANLLVMSSGNLGGVSISQLS